jgi:hypothetical protein
MKASTLSLVLPSLLAGCGVKYATVRTDSGVDLMLLGHDPVAYFVVGKPVRGDPRIDAAHNRVTYYFASEDHRKRFLAEPAKYEPQYGGFCADGAAYGVKLGSDPTEFAIHDVGPETGSRGHIVQSLYRLTFRVPWYKTGKEIMAEWRAQHPGQSLDFDPGGVFRNLFLKYPGWRAREGHGQPALGIPGMDPCPPACPGQVTQGYTPPR